MPPKPVPKQQEASPPPKQQQQQVATQPKQQQQVAAQPKQQQQVVSQQKQPPQAAPLKQAVSPQKTVASPPAKVTQELPKKGVTKEVIPPSPVVQMKAVETPAPKKNYVAEKEQEMKEYKEKQDNYLKTLLSEVKGEDYCQESEDSVEKTSKLIINRIAEGKLNLNSSPHRKIDAIEDGVIEKRILDAQKLKEQLRNQLSNVELRIDSLASQRIDNPKSLFSNPVFKHYLLGESETKRKDAIKFIKRVQSEKSKFEAKLHALEEQREQKRTMEVAEKERQQRNEQEEKEKDREERFKEKLQEIKKRQEARIKELKEFEESYIKKIKKDGQKKPLFQRYRKQFFQHEQQFRAKRLNEIKENKKQFLNVASIDFKEHQKQYFANLQKLEQEKKQQREKEIAALIEKQPQPQIVFESSKNGNKNESDGLTNEAEIEAKQKENAKKHAEARAKFSQGLKQHQQINESKEKRLEMEILIDKQINPEKYIVLIKKRTEAERYQQIQEKGKTMRKSSLDNSPTQSQSSAFKSRSFQHQPQTSKFLVEDELIFKEKVGSFKKQEPGKEKELGKSYLKSIRDSIAKHKKLALENEKRRQSNGQNNDQIRQTEPIQGKGFKNETLNGSLTQEKSGRYSTDSTLKRTLDSSRKEILPQIMQNKSALYIRKSDSSNLESKYQTIKTEPSESSHSYAKHNSKIDYLAEIRKKLNLDHRKEEWEKITSSQQQLSSSQQQLYSNSRILLPAVKQQGILQKAVDKFNTIIFRKEQLLRLSKSNEVVTLGDVENRQQLDEAYLNSIKAKIALIKLSSQSEQPLSSPQRINYQKSP